MTIVDSLDTLIIMDMHDEYSRAARWVASSMRLDPRENVSLFEATIRILGGLLSAFHLSEDEVFLRRAVGCYWAVGC